RFLEKIIEASSPHHIAEAHLYYFYTTTHRKNKERSYPMAKNDYDYIVFKILTYLYTCLKRQNSFDEEVFRNMIITKTVQEGYMIDILRMMEAEGQIEGLTFIKAWGNEYVMVGSLKDVRITSEGVRYVLNNDKMKKIMNSILEEAPGAIMELVKLAFII
ncbi:MAG: YjcQ family protein, partial [Eubacteriales bacterium]|nr:YjcQ family protein [Eubacteriales bacterium]